MFSKVFVDTIGDVGIVSFNKGVHFEDAFGFGVLLHGLLVQGQRHIILDLAGVTFLCSNVLDTIVQTSQQCIRQGGTLRLCNLTEHVAEIFSICGMDKFLSVYKDRAAALAHGQQN